MVGDQSRDSHKVTPMLESPLSSQWRNQRLRGDLSVWCCSVLGEKQCSQRVAASPTLLIQSVLVSGTGDASASLHVVGFSLWCLVLKQS